MKKFAVALLLSVVTLALVGCGAATPATEETTTPAVEVTTPAVEPTVPATEPAVDATVTTETTTEVPAVK